MLMAVSRLALFSLHKQITLVWWAYLLHRVCFLVVRSWCHLVGDIRALQRSNGGFHGRLAVLYLTKKRHDQEQAEDTRPDVDRVDIAIWLVVVVVTLCWNVCLSVDHNRSLRPDSYSIVRELVCLKGDSVCIPVDLDTVKTHVGCNPLIGAMVEIGCRDD